MYALWDLHAHFLSAFYFKPFLVYLTLHPCPPNMSPAAVLSYMQAPCTLQRIASGLWGAPFVEWHVGRILAEANNVAPPRIAQHVIDLLLAVREQLGSKRLVTLHQAYSLLRTCRD